MTKPRDPVPAGGGIRRPHELDNLANAHRSAKARSSRRTVPPRGLKDRIVWRAIGDLKEFPGNPRRHPDSQIASLMKNIRLVWTNPILVDETSTIHAGHGRLEAAMRAKSLEIPAATAMAPLTASFTTKAPTPP